MVQHHLNYGTLYYAAIKQQLNKIHRYKTNSGVVACAPSQI